MWFIIHIINYILLSIFFTVHCKQNLFSFHHHLLLFLWQKGFKLKKCPCIQNNASSNKLNYMHWVYICIFSMHYVQNLYLNCTLNFVFVKLLISSNSSPSLNFCSFFINVLFVDMTIVPSSSTWMSFSGLAIPAILRIRKFTPAISYNDESIKCAYIVSCRSTHYLNIWCEEEMLYKWSQEI